MSDYNTTCLQTKYYKEGLMGRSMLERLKALRASYEVDAVCFLNDGSVKTDRKSSKAIDSFYSFDRIKDTFLMLSEFIQKKLILILLICNYYLDLYIVVVMLIGFIIICVILRIWQNVLL